MNPNIWNVHARIYEKLWVQKTSLGPTRDTVIDLLKEVIIDTQKIYNVLDIGCGTGQLLRDIQSAFQGRCTLHGIDSAKTMIQFANQSNNGIKYEICDAALLYSRPNKYDIVLCTHSLPYYKDQRRFIQSITGIVEQSGVVIFAQASCNNIYDSLIMNFVKLTTGRAHYPGVREFSEMVRGYFAISHQIKIKKKWYMPSIYAFVLKGLSH